MTTFAARYNDGRTAASQIASVQLDASELCIRDATGATLAHWPLSEVHLVDRATSGRPRMVNRVSAGSPQTLALPTMADESAASAQGMISKSS